MAVGRATELFPNLVRAEVVRPNMVQAAEIADEDEPEDADEDAHWAGQARVLRDRAGGGTGVGRLV